MSKEQLEQAKVHIDRRQIEQAIPVLIDHLNDNFHDEEALFMLGACFLDRGKPGMGSALNRLAIQIRTDKGQPFPEALKNLGACFKAENRMDAAEEVWRLALEVAPNNIEKAQLLSNLGGLHINNGDPEVALPLFDEALRTDPTCEGGRFNRGMVHLELGNWRQGWADYGAGFGTGDRIDRRYKNLPEWDGTPGQTVIVWGEQGIGDEIMFASVLPDLIKVSKKVIFDCHPRLVKLFERSFPGVEIHGTRKLQSYLPWLDETEADASLCLSSLTTFFRNEDKDFPGKPYLKSGLALKNYPHSDSYEIRQKPFRIGISWAGGTKKTRGDLRSIALKHWLPILAVNGPEFYSLQYSPEAAADVCSLEEETGFRVRHYPGHVQCTDYDKTASFVASMDLVITVCTSIHHLSNALGVPTWTLVPSKPAWRYGAKGHLFYKDSSTFYRQEPDQPWGSLIERVAYDLMKFQKERAA
jgi:tetratricopeptide (TPR) repeat protein